MTMEHGQQQTLNPERTSATSYLEFSENPVVTDSTVQLIRYLYLSQEDLEIMEYIAQPHSNQKTSYPIGMIKKQNAGRG